MGRSRGRPSPSSPPGLQSSNKSAPASACAAKGGTRRSASWPARRRTTQKAQPAPRPQGPADAPCGGLRDRGQIRAVCGGWPRRRPRGGAPAARPSRARSRRPPPTQRGTPPRQTRGRRGPAGRGMRGSAPFPKPPACGGLPGPLSARVRPHSAGRHEQGAVRAVAPRSLVRESRGRRSPCLGGGILPRPVRGPTATRPRLDPPAPWQNRPRKWRRRAPRTSAARA